MVALPSNYLLTVRRRDRKWLGLFPFVSLFVPTLIVISERFGASEGIRATDFFIFGLLLILASSLPSGLRLFSAHVGHSRTIIRLAVLMILVSIVSFLVGLDRQPPVLMVGDQYGTYNWFTSLAHLGKKIEYLLLCLAVIALCRTPRTIDGALWSVFASAALVGLWGLVQISLGLNLDVNQAFAVVLPFHNLGGTAGVYFSILIPLVIAIYMSAPAQHKWLFLGFAVLLSVNLVYTNSRAALGGALLGVLVTVLPGFRRQVHLRFMYGVGAVVFIASIAFMVMKSSGHLAERTLGSIQAMATGQGLEQDLSLFWRLKTWEQVFTDIGKSPLLGHGPGSILAADSAYIRAVHETGILGLAVFIAFLLACFRIARNMANRFPHSSYLWLYKGYAGIIVSLAVSSFLSDNFLSIRIMENFWFLTGLFIASLTIAPQNGKRRGDARYRCSHPGH